MDPDLLKKLVRLYFKTKNLLLYGEETDPRFDTFLQPSMELRAALDHLMRAHVVDLGLSSAPQNSPGYSDKNLDKAIGHVYRAYFDTADWLSMSLRTRIVAILSTYSRETIRAVIPDYYSGIRGEIQDIDTKIAALREKKDVGSTNSESLFDEYRVVVERLGGIRSLVASQSEALEEHEKALQQETKKSRTFQWILLIAAAFIGGVVTLAVEMLVK